jgi:hypothetical protein
VNKELEKPTQDKITRLYNWFSSGARECFAFVFKKFTDPSKK